MKPEGKFQDKPPEQWIPGEKVNVVRHPDNLQPEGNFTVRETETWAPGERAPLVKRTDNLKPEGKFQDRPQEKWTPGMYWKYCLFSGVNVFYFLSKVEEYL